MFTYKLPTGASVDMDALCDVLESTDINALYYLDIETGEVLRLPEFDLSEEDKEILELIEQGSNRYEYVEPTSSQEIYEQMQRFTDSIIAGEDERLAEKLSIALDGAGAFRRFKDTLKQAGGGWIEGWYQWIGDFLFNEAQRFLATLPFTVTEEIHFDDDCPLCKTMQEGIHQHKTEFSQKQELLQNVRQVTDEDQDRK